jgi:hypothetical protein
MERSEAIEIVRKNWPDSGYSQLKEALKTLIPELKESEDERIRKWIKKELESKYVVDNIVNNVMADKALAWIERQGEQNLANSAKSCKDEPKFKVGDVIRNKWSNRTKTIIAIDNSQYILDDGMPAQPFKVNINAQDNWELVEQNPAWSEENEEMLRRCISATFDHVYLKECDWLKSLKERCTWKPSDKQMEALKVNVDRLIMQYPGYEIALKSLYDDLKKLK